MRKIVVKNLKRNNETLPFVTAWMTLEGIVLSQAEEDKNCMVSLICGNLKTTNKNRLMETETKRMVTRREVAEDG